MIGQLFGCSTLAYFTYRSSFFDVFKSDINMKQYWRNNYLTLIGFSFSLIIGKNFILFFHKICFILNAILYEYVQRKRNNRNKRKNSRLFPFSPNIFVL